MITFRFFRAGFSLRFLIGCLLVLGALRARAQNGGQGEEWLIGAQRALLHREKQPDFRYHGIEYRRTGRWLGELPSSFSEYLGAGAARPERNFGSYAFNAFAGLRYHLVRISAAELHTQVDSGVFFTDAYRRHDQRLIGQWLEFRTRATLGLGLALPGRGHPQLLVETGYEHISNAGLSKRNLGADDLCLRLGLSWHR